MPEVVFEPTIPEFEPSTKVHALDRGATVIGCRTAMAITNCNFFEKL
jgi:hypothetical protein